jgi:muramoyltetrapeptide carboxypeptidase
MVAAVERVIRQPEPLATGAHVRVISPSKPDLHRAPYRAARAEAVLAELGLRVSYGEHAWAIRSDGVAAGSAQQRAADFLAAFADPDVDAVLCATGGLVSVELLAHLGDLSVVRENPKPFIGECDNVWLNLVLLAEAGLSSFIGMSYLNHFGESGGPFPETTAGFRRAVMGTGELEFRPAAGRTSQWFNWSIPELERTPRTRDIDGGWHWVVPGAGRGPLLGGEAFFLPQLIKRFGLALDGAVLFWDMASTNRSTVHRVLEQMAGAADLLTLHGMLVGPSAAHPPGEWAGLVRRAIADVLGEVRYPVLVNADVGHLSPAWLMPYGLEIVLDSERGVRMPRAAQGAVVTLGAPRTAAAQAGPPDGELAARIQTILRRVLRASELPPSENFFAAGGTSVLAGVAVALLRTQVDDQLSLEEFLRHPTAAALARTVATRHAKIGRRN